MSLLSRHLCIVVDGSKGCVAAGAGPELQIGLISERVRCKTPRNWAERHWQGDTSLCTHQAGFIIIIIIIIIEVSLLGTDHVTRVLTHVETF